MHSTEPLVRRATIEPTTFNGGTYQAVFCRAQGRQKHALMCPREPTHFERAKSCILFCWRKPQTAKKTSPAYPGAAVPKSQSCFLTPTQHKNLHLPTSSLLAALAIRSVPLYTPSSSLASSPPRHKNVAGLLLDIDVAYRPINPLQWRNFGKRAPISSGPCQLDPLPPLPASSLPQPASAASVLGDAALSRRIRMSDHHPKRFYPRRGTKYNTFTVCVCPPESCSSLPGVITGRRPTSWPIPCSCGIRRPDP